MPCLPTPCCVIQGICDLLRCCICMCDVNDARICPRCAKLCCYNCIRRWITERQAQCPHCRTALVLADLVKCNWIEEVTQRLDRLKAMPVNDADICSTHREKLTVYCVPCERCICHHCALWGGKEHEGHSLVPIGEECAKRLAVLEAGLPALRGRLQACKDARRLIETDIEVVKANCAARNSEVRDVMEEITARIDTQTKAKLNLLAGEQRELAMEMKTIAEVIAEIERYATAPGAGLLRRCDALHRAMQRVQRDESLPRSSAIVTDFPSELIPEYHTARFRLRPFSSLRGSNDPVYSPPLFANGLSWRLKVYPNGNGQVRGTYISVFLELSTGSTQKHRYDYRIEYRQGHGGHNVVREYCSEFEVGECWGYNCFCETTHVEACAARLDDTVTLEFAVRPHSYMQKCRDLEWYIEQMKKNANGESGGSEFPLIELDEEQPARFIGKESTSRMENGVDGLRSRQRRLSMDNLTETDETRGERDVGDYHALAAQPRLELESDNDDGGTLRWRDTLGRIESAFRVAMAAAELGERWGDDETSEELPSEDNR